uniref:uncharacterized protein LOC118146728 n=1 Tax=Callithrix jacchus TaxID=9483 RepID=UPI0023DD51EE|nr:uncharacterized protein LOC118146728 [Callithrix jacchus]XP_054099650.1 uncharacterized protein LOC118146728 [Callithrix jacchus]XP_054099651.1 uncharacterized protein LOC118146728 [Callithrix jacchus]XP_054099652.1 uncharacterized protein LOC118146728 [Callithrix jacchus]XP_054099653.1 uncharacterized protein LOC118146728 [Callithrix jacchus]XP_054099654.1 uncharacterized protein LOC118146728 [Callithrix jacchus]
MKSWRLCVKKLKGANEGSESHFSSSLGCSCLPLPPCSVARKLAVCWICACHPCGWGHVEGVLPKKTVLSLFLSFFIHSSSVDGAFTLQAKAGPGFWLSAMPPQLLFPQPPTCEEDKDARPKLCPKGILHHCQRPQLAAPAVTQAATSSCLECCHLAVGCHMASSVLAGGHTRAGVIFLIGKLDVAASLFKSFQWLPLVLRKECNYFCWASSAHTLPLHPHSGSCSVPAHRASTTHLSHPSTRNLCPLIVAWLAPPHSVFRTNSPGLREVPTPSSQSRPAFSVSHVLFMALVVCQLVCCWLLTFSVPTGRQVTSRAPRILPASSQALMLCVLLE